MIDSIATALRSRIHFGPVHTARYILEDLKPRVSGVRIIPWLPRRLYVLASSPLDIRRAMSPSHRDAVHNIILVPPEEATQIFSASPTLPCRSWVRIRRGKYKTDLGYVLTCDDDMVDVLVVPRERPYDLPEEKLQDIRALFNWHTAHEAELTLTAIANSKDITAFQCNGASFFCGLLRLSLVKDEVERVLIPHVDEIFLHLQSGIDPELAEKSCVLFSSQFWREGDIVRSSSPELLGERAAIIDVNIHQQSVSLLHDGHVYHCHLLEQRRIFTLGDQVRVIAGPDRGRVGMIVTVLQHELVLSLQTDLSNEVSIKYCHTISQLLSFVRSKLDIILWKHTTLITSGHWMIKQATFPTPNLRWWESNVVIWLVL